MKEIYDIETTIEVENGKEFVCFRYNTHLIGKIAVPVVMDGGFTLYDRAWHTLLTFGIETEHLPKGLKEAVEITTKEYRDKVPNKNQTFSFLNDVSIKTPWALVRS